MADENVPPGITQKQDEIIQYVAKYVVSSCDGARYQQKIRTRTKHNSYFAFLDAKHPYHHYYQYLLDSYRYYIQNSDAVGGGGWGGAADAGSGAQQQWTDEEYYQYYGANQGQAGDISFQTGEAEPSGPADAVQQQPQPSASLPGHEAIASGGDATAPTEGANVEAEDDEDNEEEEYELVMENGEWVSRKRS